MPRSSPAAAVRKDGRAAQGPRAAPPSIALLVIDTLRRDHLGAYGYERATTPGIDRWSRRGLVFDSAYTPVPFTAPAVMSLLTGLYPEHHRVRQVFQRLPPQSLTLPQYLKPSGYHTAAVVSNMVLTNEATGLAGRFDYFDDYVDEPVRWSGTRERPAFERTAERTTDAALAWLTKAKGLGRPLFIWVHCMDPHGPYTPPAQPFRHDKPVPFDPQRVPAYNRTPGVTDGAEIVDRYDGEIAHTDRAVARFIEAWEREPPGPERRGVDRGPRRDPHGARARAVVHARVQRLAGAGAGAADRGGGRHPQGRREEPVSLLDVVPTLLAIAGHRTPPLSTAGPCSLRPTPSASC